ncbi:NADPH:quinone reductase-like Zn-dependent oxidoreductase [Tumebacillus sp. BK434]|uniref:zinc-dependent alcohol dehydrogenase family protein n=1 Tax=Tumebacillus sp. BK434 TaxID=2512169 RepID=UPI001044F5ED|nr:zinc-dependent alcohol dehydrogenase family protein [Tumebacillus sp. BK434]TCP54445.1 NADPH:quinone reductase-like Zn-dependent oxidoreductase [Tumebacillus sp. BK434]
MLSSLRYKQFGHPLEVLELEQRVDVPLHPDEIRVRMLLSPINPSDLIPIRGAYKHRIQLPAIPGYEGVGVVEGIGSSVPTTLLGKRVLPLRGEGTWQQYVKTKANYAIRVPDEIDDETASQMYINPVTAWLICTEELRLKSDDVLIVNACGSAIGRIFAQFSKVFGYKLIAAVRNDIHTQELQSLGAWAVINTSKESLVNRVKELTDGVGATAGIDSIGGQDGNELIECIRVNGTVLSIGLLSGIQIDWAKKSNITVKPYWLRRWIEGASDLQWHKTFDDISNLLKEKKLIIQTARERFGLSEYKKAIQSAEYHGLKGKVLFAPSLFK